MSTIRGAILVAFVGASLWVIVPLAMYHGPTIPNPFATLSPSNPYVQFLPRSGDAVRERLVTGSVRSEIVVLTIAGVAWVLAGMVKPKN